MIFAEGLSYETMFLIDMGMEINVIRKQHLHSYIKINTNNIICIAEINKEKIKRIGSTTINYCKHEIQHVVKDDFPIVQEEI